MQFIKNLYISRVCSAFRFVIYLSLNGILLISKLFIRKPVPICLFIAIVFIVHGRRFEEVRVCQLWWTGNHGWLLGLVSPRHRLPVDRHHWHQARKLHITGENHTGSESIARKEVLPCGFLPRDTFCKRHTALFSGGPCISHLGLQWGPTQSHLN